MTKLEYHLLAERNHHEEIQGCAVCIHKTGLKENPECWKNLFIGELFPRKFCNYERRKDISLDI